MERIPTRILEICCLLTPYSTDKLVPFSPFSNRTIKDCLSFMEMTDHLHFTDMTIVTLVSLFSIQRRASHRAWNTGLWVNKNSFECFSLVTTRASAAFFFESKKPFHLTARFNAVLLKRIWLRILIVTNKYSWPNRDQRKSPDNREIRIIEVRIIKARL